MTRILSAGAVAIAAAIAFSGSAQASLTGDTIVCSAINTVNVVPIGDITSDLWDSAQTGGLANGPNVVVQNAGADCQFLSPELDLIGDITETAGQTFLEVSMTMPSTVGFELNIQEIVFTLSDLDWIGTPGAVDFFALVGTDFPNGVIASGFTADSVSFTIDFPTINPGESFSALFEIGVASANPPLPATVPLPASLPLLGLALVGLGYTARRRRTAA